MTNPIYTGPLKDHLQNYVDLKRSLGHKFDHEVSHLKRLDSFILEKSLAATGLTKEIVVDWCSKKTYETEATRYRRAALIRKFGTYLESIGVKAYIIPMRYYSKGNQYIPYIYTKVELEKFFAEADNDKGRRSYECPYRRQITPVIFRMFYMCGLRLSEASLLKVADVDLEEGVLSILHSKKGNSRLVPMPDALTERCRTFSKEVHLLSGAGDYYFPALGGQPITKTILYYSFRRFLWKAGIAHGGRGRGPRIHDFRHTYAVHCLKNGWNKTRI
ncbi:MAG: tyrosine-type recombinase/integrase [Flavobacteriales bacterium]|nr:tyrosine-type recombinase/integrase [Flavobacteriales bacterium]